MFTRTMKKVCSFFLCCLVMGAWCASACAFEPVVAPEVFAKLQVVDQVPVLILLREKDDPAVTPRSGTTEKPGKAVSRQRIKALQNEFLSMVEAAGLGGDLKVGRRLDHVPLLTGRINSRALAALAANPYVAQVTADRVMHASLAESGPLVGSCQVQAAGFTGAGVAVAVIDTGIDGDHPFLQDSILWEECFLADGGCPLTGGDRASGPGSAEDDASHGTHVAGIITSSDPDHQGVAPGAKIVALKVLDDQGVGSLSDILAAADWVISNKDRFGIRVINLSLGTEGTFGGCCDNIDPISAMVVNTARSAGITIVAASGNDAAAGEITMPACFSGVVSVGAVYDDALGVFSWEALCQDSATAADQVACFSNASSELDLLAPGAMAFA